LSTEPCTISAAQAAPVAHTISTSAGPKTLSFVVGVEGGSGTFQLCELLVPARDQRVTVELLVEGRAASVRVQVHHPLSDSWGFASEQFPLPASPFHLDVTVALHCSESSHQAAAAAALVDSSPVPMRMTSSCLVDTVAAPTTPRPWITLFECLLHGGEVTSSVSARLKDSGSLYDLMSRWRSACHTTTRSLALLQSLVFAHRQVRTHRHAWI
jgi:hypothetical protein